MHIILVAIAALVFATGVLYKSIPNTEIKPDESKKIKVETQVLNSTDESTSSAEITEPTETSKANINTNINIDKNIDDESLVSEDPNDFIYPNSELVENNLYQTTDDADVVTEWYKSQIRNLNYNVKNFASTTVNGQVENKLVGADSDSEIEITITKPSDSDIVNIEIN